MLGDCFKTDHEVRDNDCQRHSPPTKIIRHAPWQCKQDEQHALTCKGSVGGYDASFLNAFAATAYVEEAGEFHVEHAHGVAVDSPAGARTSDDAVKLAGER